MEEETYEISKAAAPRRSPSPPMENASATMVEEDSLTVTGGGGEATMKKRCCCWRPSSDMSPFLLLISISVFVVLCGAGIATTHTFVASKLKQEETNALGLALETGTFFDHHVHQAILPLFSIAQFAIELEQYKVLPELVGPAKNGLPLIVEAEQPPTHRNVSGVCDAPALVEHFTKIASTIKRHAQMENILVNLQLAPQGVVCLLHPLNNTEDFEDGQFLDNSGAWGLDLFTSPVFRYIAEQSIQTEQVGVAGPLRLIQCPECDPFLIARLPIAYDGYNITIDGTPYPRWGFATAIIAWKELVMKSGIHQIFEKRAMDFQLTRTDRTYQAETDTYEVKVVVLTQTNHFEARSSRGDPQVTTALDATSNGWEMTVIYANNTNQWWWLLAPLILVVAAFMSSLIFIVLRQKQSHLKMKSVALAHETKVNTEKNVTAYFAHELRNPLYAIDCAIQAMPTETLNEEARELLSSMELCSSFMGSIMNNLLDVRKMEEGKMELRPQRMSLSRLIHGIHKMLLPSARVDFSVDCEIGTRDYVMADEHRIQQVWTNVVTNAVKHTVSGSITLKLRWIENNACVEFQCIDTGPGIPKQDQEQLFERFVQRGGSPGTGLGLAIAKHICTLMNGTIRFDSDPTVKPGTTCIVVLPLEPDIERVVDQVPGQQQQPSMIEEPISIFIVDDVKINRKMLTKRIHKGIAPNAVITEASTGEEALEMMLSQKHFDVVIMDQFMEQAGGVLTGTQVIEQVRKGSNASSIVIGCSGNDLDEEFYAAGADWVWKKPLPSNSEIVQQLQRLLRREGGEMNV